MRAVALLTVVCATLSSLTSAHGRVRRQNPSASTTTTPSTSSTRSTTLSTSTTTRSSSSTTSTLTTTTTTTTTSSRSSTSTSLTSTSTTVKASSTTSPGTSSTTSSTSTTPARASTTTTPRASSTTSISAPAASAFCSNSDLTYALSPIAGPVQGAGTPNGRSTWQLSIDDTSSGYKQTIDGFGAAVTDATVASFNTLSSARRDQLYSQLLTSSGAAFNFFRHTIGASDLTADPPYTYDDVGTQGDGTALPSFTLTTRGTAMASMIAQMQTKNAALKVLGSPWSAPGWMKLNRVIQGNTTQNNLDDGYLTDNGPRYSQSFANYFVKYLNAFQNLGAKVSAITLQNEPLNSQAGYPTMYMYSYEQSALIQNYVGPTLKSAGLSADIWSYDHNTDVPSFPQTVLNGAGNYTNTVAWHCYANPLDWTVLTSFHNSNPSAKQYMTECWTPASASWEWAATFTMGPLQNWASGAMAWTVGTDTSDGPHLSTGGCSTCQGLVTVTGSDSYRFNTAYYMMAQFSKFMPRGATVLNGSGSYTFNGGGGVQSVATLNPDGTRSVAILNTFGNDVYTTLTTSGETWSGNVPTKSLVTWILPKK